VVLTRSSCGRRIVLLRMRDIALLRIHTRGILGAELAPDRIQHVVALPLLLGGVGAARLNSSTCQFFIARHLLRLSCRLRRDGSRKAQTSASCCHLTLGCPVALEWQVRSLRYGHDYFLPPCCSVLYDLYEAEEEPLGSRWRELEVSAGANLHCRWAATSGFGSMFR